ncbi:DUF3465 domain-containing protein [Psychrobacter sp. LV10R520-6]|uniref:DUF3465 domain-containing protein n=1 Tax=Psychrobacter sp. LV10R520-6 TaxID=1415574 RepID=UPI0024C900B9|nr:DUF3465 domain-containing protein [Psychrobacter sp. LV10R520-6]SNT71382.1 Protein of unknown function [Psychrobacter sp. LV10R520-6]
MYRKTDSIAMNIPKLSNTVINQTQHLAISLLAGIVLLSGCQPSDSLYIDEQNNSQFNSDTNACQNDTIISAFKAKQSDRQVKGCATVIKVLPDDDKGSRHQKILVELDGVSPKQTLLLVHNIDLAPRVADVSRGTALSFYGEYVYNDKGGLVHWTHHDRSKNITQISLTISN